MSKFLLLLGPSGVGKSTVINELLSLDEKFIYISPYMTRPLRVGEKNKIPISEAKMAEMESQGKFLKVNTLFGGIKYGTPMQPIVEALRFGNYPVLDWPIQQIDIMEKTFPEAVFSVYLEPPSMEVLLQRMASDKRDIDGRRQKSAEEELQKYWNSEYGGLFTISMISTDGKQREIALAIYRTYVKSFEQP